MPLCGGYCRCESRTALRAMVSRRMSQVLLLRRAPNLITLPHLIGMWRQRLEKSERNVEVWQLVKAHGSEKVPARLLIETG